MCRFYASRFFLTLVLASAVAASALAQTSRDGGGGGGGQSAQAMAQLQQMAVERNALLSQVERLKQEVATAQAAAAKAEAQLGALRSRAGSAEAKVKAAEAGKETAEQASTRLQVMGRLKQTAETLKTTDGERSDLADKLAALTRLQNTCVDNNAALYLVASEVIDRYEGLGLGNALARSEPFTRLARTRAENAADAYRDRIAALREKAAVEKAEAAARAARAAGAASGSGGEKR